MVKVYVGYDAKFGDAAYRVCKASILDHASIPVDVIPIRQDWLRRVGLYRRQFFMEDGQTYDSCDGKPFSTEFSFTRFLVPSLQPEGWAVWCDSDFLFRADIADLVALQSNAYAAMCVKHEYRPEESRKMNGQIQSPYARKNWSSLMMWNCSHPSTRMLTPYMVNRQDGSWLHQLTWMPDEEIGSIPEEWNWLDGHSTLQNPKAVHFTRGTPDMTGWEDTEYAGEWMAMWARL